MAGIGGSVLPQFRLAKVIVHPQIQSGHASADDNAEGADFREHENILQLRCHAHVVAIEKS